MADVEINLESTDSKELLKSGHHAFVIKDYANAAAALGKATQIMAQEHGDEHDSLGEVYLHYARALLELTRDESEPLGDAIPQGEEDSDSDEQNGEGEEGEDQNGEAEDENQENEANEKADTENKADIEEKEKTETNVNKSEEEKHEENGEKSETKAEEKLTNGHAEPGPSTSNGTEENAEPTEESNEPSDLQIAWEVLEVAKKIFTARGDNGKELLSQTHILLGEVGMESENFNDAVNDIKAGLEIQETLYENTNRKIAESYYKLGMAQATVSNFDEAVKCFEKSIEILKGRIELLKKEKDDESNKKEIQEMEELLPEIEEKINDMRTVKEETEKVKAEMAEACSNKLEKKEGESSSSPSATKEVKDISHLVKRKRKITDETAECPQPAKKPTP